MEIILYLLVPIIAIAAVIQHYSRSHDVLDHWAKQNGFRIIEAKYAHVFKGPFFWTASKGQSVYRVVVEDQTGRTRHGWVRCGSWMWGVWSDEAQVHWDDE